MPKNVRLAVVDYPWTTAKLLNRPFALDVEWMIVFKMLERSGLEPDEIEVKLKRMFAALDTFQHYTTSEIYERISQKMSSEMARIEAHVLRYL